MSINEGDFFRAAIEWDMPEEQKAFNVLALKCYQGTCTEAEFLTGLAAWLTTAFATVQGIMHNNVDLAECKVNKVIWSVDEWIVDRYIGTVLPTFTAADGTDMLPHAVSGNVTFPTIKPKRRGRISVPGLTEAQQSDSLLVAGAATALGNLAVALRTAFNPGAAWVGYWVIGKGGTGDVSTGFSVNGLVGSQDRRKPGVGI